MKKWKSLEKKEIFCKYGRGIEEVVFEMPDKTKEKYYLHKENDGALVFALTKDNEVIIVKQFRPGPEKIMLEIPAGSVDKGEKFIESAKRELLEETGYKSNDVEYVTSLYKSVYSNAQNHLFIAKNCELVASQNLDRYEDIEVILQTLPKFREELKKRTCSTIVSMSYCALDYLNLL